MSKHTPNQLQIDFTVVQAPSVEATTPSSVSPEDEAQIDKYVEQGSMNRIEAEQKVLGGAALYGTVAEHGTPTLGSGVRTPVRGAQKPKRRSLQHETVRIKRVSDEPPAHIRAQMGRR